MTSMPSSRPAALHERRMVLQPPMPDFARTQKGSPMTNTDTNTVDTTTITYEVGAGRYPYRGPNGERMCLDEAVTYLHTVGVRTSEAHRRLEMIEVTAIRDAPTPRIAWVSGGHGLLYRLEGADPQPRDQVVFRLVSEWRLTRGEAAALLDRAPQARPRS